MPDSLHAKALHHKRRLLPDTTLSHPGRKKAVLPAQRQLVRDHVPGIVRLRHGVAQQLLAKNALGRSDQHCEGLDAPSQACHTSQTGVKPQLEGALKLIASRSPTRL